MLICISGMDCTGKSTICNLLSQQLNNCPVIHFDKPKNKEDGKKQYFDFIKSHDFINNDIICDRFHDGEHVYAPIYRGYESDYLQELEVELKKIPFLFINTTANLDIIKERIKNRGEDFVQEEHYQLVLDKFNEFLEKQSMPYIKVDTSDSDMETYIKNILNAIFIVNSLFNYAEKNNLGKSYYGNLYSKLFISNNKIQKYELIEKKYYNDCWISNTNNDEFNKFQFELLKTISRDIKYIK